MKCPNCGGEMAGGQIRIQASTVGTVIAGATAFLAGGGGGAREHLYFHPDGGGKAAMVLDSQQSATAARCGGCNAVVLAGLEAE
jgi:hypothetical protein